MATVTAPRPDLDVSPTLTARASAAVAVVVALLAALALPIDGVGSAGPGGLRLLSGPLEQRVDDAWVVVEPDTTLPAGTWIRAGDGVAELARPGVNVALQSDTVLVIEQVLDLQRGSLLVSAQTRTGATTGLVVAEGRGTWRIDGGQTGRVATYDGTTSVRDGSGRELVLRPYQQVPIVSGAIDGEPGPLTYVADDPFDRRLMADALSIDDFLAALGRGLRADYGEEPQTLAFYRDFDGLDGAVAEALVALADGSFAVVAADGRYGPPERLLVAGVLSEAVALAQQIDPAVAAERVRAARLSGAAWGLIATREDVGPAEVRAAADRALTRRRELAAEGEATPVFTAPPPSQEPGTPDDPTGQEPPPPTDPDTDPEPDPDTTDEDGDVGGAVDPVVDELPDEAGGPVDETVDLVDELIDDGAEVLEGAVDAALGGGSSG